MEEIRRWLSGDSSFDEGLALFVKYSRNRHIARYLMRKRDGGKLRYELEKICRNRAGSASGPSVSAVPVPAAEDERDPAPNERLRIAVKDRLQYEDLPEEIRQEYVQACRSHRATVSLHAKMKLVETDEQRRAVRDELIEQDRLRAACWDRIERWAAGELLSEAAAESPVEVTPKALNAARAALTRNLKLLKETDDPKRQAEIVERLRPRVATVLAAGGTFGENAELLEKYGLLLSEK